VQPWLKQKQYSNRIKYYYVQPKIFPINVQS